jgi:hypothetical protein
MIEKNTEVESIRIDVDGVIFIEETVVFTEDGDEVGRSDRKSRCISPGDSLAAETGQVRGVAELIHTPEVVAAHQQKKDARKMGFRE